MSRLFKKETAANTLLFISAFRK